MRIVRRPEFLKMPPGTLYSKYKHCVFDDLQIKEETCGSGNDWIYQNVIDAIEFDSSEQFCDDLHAAAETGKSLRMDFDCLGRDGAFESDEQMFAVWERADVEALIERLQMTLTNKLGCKVCGAERVPLSQFCREHQP